MIGIFKGLMTTLSTAMRRPVTIDYPNVKHPLSVRERSFPILLYDFEHDEPFCTGCNICVRNCPVDCMTAVMKDNPKYDTGESPKKKVVEKFWIDYARCMRCNICVEVCPFEAIAMDNTWEGHEQAVYDRLDLHKDISDLLEGSISGKITNPFFPYDNVAKVDAELEGKEAPPESAQGARPEARLAALQRVEEGLPMGLQGEPPPDAKPKTAASAKGGATGAAAGAAEGGTGKGEFHSPEKQRARRMRAERAAREAATTQGMPEAEVEAFVERAGKWGVAGSKPEEAVERALSGDAAPEVGADAPTAAVASSGGGAGVPLGELLLPAGPKGDPMSHEKQRARRMRAERVAREQGETRGVSGTDLDEAVTRAGLFGVAGDKADDAVEKAFSGADLPPEIQALMGGGGGAEGPVATGSGPSGGEEFALPLGAKGEPNSAEKQRARRMRAERAARETAEGKGISGENLEALLKRAGWLGMEGQKADEAVENALQELGL